MKLGKGAIYLLIAISVTVFMDGLDGSIVNIALPIIAEYFGTDTGTVSWVSIAYLLVVAGSLIIFGKIAARGYLKRIFLLGIALFTIASVICGLSPSLLVLIGGRVLQGLGASMIISCAPIICVKHLPADILGMSIGLISSVSAISFCLGPALGGLIAYALSWSWIFWINIPIGIFAFIFVSRVLPKDVPEHTGKFDIPGAILLFIAIAAGTFGLERMPHLGVDNPLILSTVIVAAAALVLFCIVELKAKEPLLNIRIFKLFPVVAVILAFLIMKIVVSGLFYLLPFYFSNAMGLDTLLSGILMLIGPAGMVICSVPFAKWSDRTGRRWFCVVSTVILVIVSIFFSFLSPTWSIVFIIVALAILGIAAGIGSGPSTARIIETVPEEEKDSGSTVMMTCLYLGTVIGTAVYAAGFTFFSSKGESVVSFADLPTDIFMNGFHGAMVIGLILAVASCILSLVVKDRKKAAKENAETEEK